MSVSAVSSGSIPVTHSNGHQIYNLAANKTLPEFLAGAARSKKSLRYDQEYRNRLELIQDFGFQAASVSLQLSPDGNFILASGVYPPEIRVYDVRDLGLKFSRRFDAEPVAAIFLGDDFRKIAILRNDRHVELHAQYGRHEVVRIPDFGRALAFDRSTAVLYVAGSKSSVYRLDLEEGIWLTPLKLEAEEGASVLALASGGFPLLAVGLEQTGEVVLFDTREAERAAAVLRLPDEISGVSSLAWAPDMRYLAVGTAEGKVYVFDIRSKTPQFTFDHRNDSPITSLVFCSSEATGGALALVSSDRKGIKVFSCSPSFTGSSRGSGGGNGAFVLGIEATAPVMDVLVVEGLVLAASESPRMGIWFVPGLGPAPKWCAHLDGLVQELEATEATGGGKAGTGGVFHDYVFVSAEQLTQLGGDSLVGSDLVKPHLHGFFLDERLYRKLSAAARPEDALDAARFEDERVEKLTRAKTAMRKPAARGSGSGSGNRNLRELLVKKTQEVTKVKKHDREIARNVLEDKRFAKLWNNPDFEIDQH